MDIWIEAGWTALIWRRRLALPAGGEAANAAEPPDNVLRLAVAEQATIMRRRLAARQAALADAAR